MGGFTIKELRASMKKAADKARADKEMADKHDSQKVAKVANEGISVCAKHMDMIAYTSEIHCLVCEIERLREQRTDIHLASRLVRAVLNELSSYGIK